MDGRWIDELVSECIVKVGGSVDGWWVGRFMSW